MVGRNVKKPIDYNWPQLFVEWCKSGLPKAAFLRSKGISPAGMIAKRKTADWVLDLDLAKKSLMAADQDRDQEVERVLKDIDRSEALREERDAKVVAKGSIDEIWQIVQSWRHRQAENDYKLADVIRLHCKVYLKNALRIRVGSEGEKIYETTLKPSELLSIARVSETIQKVQRLALGLSTENVGVDSGEMAEEENVPVFEVQVNENGKFVNLR